MRTGCPLILQLLSAILAGCGGGGGAVTPIEPPDPGVAVTVYYLRVDPSYDGWGLHLWGSAIAASVATDWSSPQQVVAATALANATFDPVLGTGGQAVADAGGDLTIEVAGRSTVVYISRR